MTAESAGDMMVLAVDVVGYRPADTHELRPRRRRQEPAVGQREIDDLRQRYACLAADHTGPGIEVEEAAQVARVDEGAAIIGAAIPVTTSLPASQQ
jgi:hypothetical protein